MRGEVLQIECTKSFFIIFNVFLYFEFDFFFTLNIIHFFEMYEIFEVL